MLDVGFWIQIFLQEVTEATEGLARWALTGFDFKPSDKRR
jgi:hypothetical protein